MADWKNEIELEVFPGMVRSHFAVAYMPVEEQVNR